MLTQPALPSRAPAPGARALYLGARERKHVSSTAEALVVRNESLQTRRYPLARVSRIVSSTLTDWSGAALALCMKNGVGITWLDGSGTALGTCYPNRRVRPGLRAELEALTESESGLARYRNWHRSRRMEVMLRWAKQHADRVDPTQWEETKREWVYGDRFAIRLNAGLEAHCMAWVGSQLALHGIHPQLWGPEAQPIDLDHDLCRLLWAEMNLCTGAVANSAHQDEPLTALFERWNSVNGGVLLLHINSLHRTAMKFNTGADT